MSVKNKQENTGKGKRITLWAVIALLAVVLLALVLLWWGLYNTADQPEDPNAGTSPYQISTVIEEISVHLGGGMELTNIGAYTGAYVEDGSNEVVSGVLMVTITNNGADAVEYAEISVPTPAGTAEFSVSTLLPGTSVVLLEKNRMAYSGEESYEQATADPVALFKQPVSKCEDRLQIQALDGIINVINISGEDITGDIVIYYKNFASDLYYGGVTFRVRIEGGMKQDEIKQLAASHFSASGSQVVFVTIG